MSPAASPALSNPSALETTISATRKRTDPSQSPGTEPVRRKPPTASTITNWLQALMRGEDWPRPTSAELQPFVDASRRSCESLLGAYRATKDRAFLKEAMEKYKEDPRVAFAAYYANLQGHDEPTAPERQEWLEKFKASAPENALANFLSARDYFKSGQPAKAIEELRAGYGKPFFQDYSLSFVQDAEEAFRAAGLSEAQAKAMACSELPLPHLSELKQLGVDLANLSKAYRQAGDEASAQAAVEYAANVGQRLAPGTGSFLITELVGMAVERLMLQTLDPASPYGGSGQTAQQRLDDLAKKRDEFKAVAKDSERILLQMSDPDLASYFDRLKTQGEQSALKWARAKYGP